MADAVPVNPEEVVAPVEAAPKATKKATGGISADVLAELKAQVKEELLASMTPFAQDSADANAPDTFKVAGGVKLESHEATREDF